MVASAAHCHIHLNTFVSPTLNKVWELFLTVVRGTSISLMRFHHVNNHHTHTNSNQDWMNTHALLGPLNLRRNIFYIGYGLKKSGRGLREAQQSNFWNKQQKKQISFEKVLAVAPLLVSAVYNPKVFFMVLFPAWFLGICLLILSNLWNHEREPSNAEVGETIRDFTSPMLNYFLFNGGYHWGHHLRPSTHWSEYVGMQQKFLEKDKQITDGLSYIRLVEISFLRFFYRLYVKGGQRA